MAEELQSNKIQDVGKRYEELIPQIEALISYESDLIANLANVSAALFQAMDYLWVGFYIVKNDELVLGPYQGPIACTRIQKGKGVCGVAWAEARTILVDDVNAFPNHIACSSESNSEIVIPIQKDGKVVMVLDIDSADVAAFTELDQKHLESLVEILQNTLEI